MLPCISVFDSKTRLGNVAAERYVYMYCCFGLLVFGGELGSVLVDDADAGQELQKGGVSGARYLWCAVW